MFEVDRPSTQAWKRQRLLDLGYGIPGWLRFVPFNFEAGESWWLSCLGVSMYLTHEAIVATLRRVAVSFAARRLR